MLLELRLLHKMSHCVLLPQMTLSPHQLMFLCLVECWAGPGLGQAILFTAAQPRQLVGCQLQYVGVLGNPSFMDLERPFQPCQTMPMEHSSTYTCTCAQRHGGKEGCRGKLEGVCVFHFVTAKLDKWSCEVEVRGGNSAVRVRWGLR